MTKFICCVCGQENEDNVLSEYSYFTSGEDSAEKAIDKLPEKDIVCAYCTGELDPVEESKPLSVTKVDYMQNRFGIDILSADAGMRSFIEQNY